MVYINRFGKKKFFSVIKKNTLRIKIIHFNGTQAVEKIDYHNFIFPVCLTMAEMDDVYIKLQAFLIKKDKDCDQLRFLTSRTTVENSEHIQDVCNSVGNILKACAIPVEDDTSKTDSRCVQAFNYLILNTNFDCQEHLSEDILNGHLVDMSPPLSPYLLTEILCSLKYEQILAQSILHVPLDLAVEMLHISRRCISLLDFSRGLDFLEKITQNCHKKMLLINEIGAQTTKLEESLEMMMIHCQVLISLFLDPKFLKPDEVEGLKKSERTGLIFQKLLSLTKNCLKNCTDDVKLSTEIETIYKLTFGRAALQRPIDGFATQLRLLDQEFIHILLKKLKEIDCNTYLGWASLEAFGNTSTSLQQSIGNDCYNMIEFLKGYEHLPQYDHLIECLLQISSKPQPKASCSELNFDEMRKGADDGNKECIKELMKRYKEWNHETFDTIRKNRSLLDKDDLLNLLEYLTFIITKPGQEEHKQLVYSTVTKVLLQQNIPELYETILEYIIKHDGRNTLESAHTDESFKRFMSSNTNFKSPRNLRILLYFLLKNPCKILAILIKISIGEPEYDNFMISPSDLILLSPVMKIRDKEDSTIFLTSLRNVCIDSAKWNTKKFAHFVKVMLDNCIFTTDKIINNVFIPYLNERTIALSNMRSLLNTLRKIAPTCTNETQIGVLLETLGKCMARVRNDILIPKHSSHEVLSLMTRIIEILSDKAKNWFNAEEKSSLIERLERLEPIDKSSFTALLQSSEYGRINIWDIIRDYERRCFLTINRVRANSEIEDNEESKNFNDFSRFNDDFLRHIFLKSTETEYFKFATHAIWDNWGGTGDQLIDEFNYDKIVHITIQAIVYCLEFPNCNSPNSFVSLFKSLARYAMHIPTVFQESSDVDKDKFYESLVNNLRNLEKFIRNTVFSSLYTNFILSTINNRADDEPVLESIDKLGRSIGNFANKCLDIAPSEMYFDLPHSIDATKYRIAHEFITECMSVKDDGSYQSLCKVYKLLCSPATVA